MSALRAARVGLPLVVIAAGILLRVVHLNTPSLWWDEIVEIATAELPDVGSVVRQVREGIPPGRGNAGAMPLDYVLLHGWLETTSLPPAPYIELHYRFPAFVWASLGLVAMFACGCSLFGWGTGVLAAAVLALMIPHVLYAAEVRPYALIMLLSILNVMAFARLSRRPDRPSAWLVWAASALAFLSAALFAVIALAMQQAVLGMILVRRLGGRAGALALGSIGALAVVVGVWYAGVDLVQPHGRGSLAAGASWRETLSTFDFVFSHDRLLAVVFLLSLPVPIVRAWRGERALLPVAVVLSCGVLVVPLVVEVERWKDYYFHPRHILFVLPYLALVTGIGIDAALARLDPLRVFVRDDGWRTWTTVLAAVVLVSAVHAPVVERYLRTPDVFFARTKTLRDFKSLARGITWQLWHAEPGTRIVLVAERNRAGHIGNPVLRRYLRWWGIERRVALHGTDQPEAMVETLAAECPDGCDGGSVDALVQRLQVGEAIDSPVRFRGLLQLAGPEDVGGGKIAAIGVLAYPRGGSGPPAEPPPSGWRLDVHPGLRLTQRQGSAARVSQ